MPQKFDASRVLAGLKGANREAQGRYLGDLARRERASGILQPGDVAGEYDGGRMLLTTLGGVARALTADDLVTFRANVRKAGKKFKGGITAKSVIDMSLPEDRERANREIRHAVPFQSMGARMHFITNSGPNSDVARHHVHIELLNYGAAVSSPTAMADVVKMLVTGPLKFDCDCGRHTYWYRYIATIGRFNAGRDEPGYPKIRNPKLHGVACKHVLRVMQQLTGPAVRIRVQKMVEAGRQSLARKVIVTTKADAQEIARQQEAQAGWKRNLIESTGERNARLARQRMVRVETSIASKKAMTPSKRTALVRAAQALFDAGFITQAALAKLIKKVGTLR